MSLQERFMTDLKLAMREGDVERREALRMLRAAVMSEEMELQRQAFESLRARTPETDLAEAEKLPRRSLTDEETVRVIERLVKRHQDSIDQFQRGGREDLVAHEQAQLAVIQGYLPERMGRAEIEQLVRTAIEDSGARGPQETGKVMQRLAGELRGKADLKEVSQLVQELLAP